MRAITRSGHVVEESASWARCLKVKRDFRRRADCGENGEEAMYGCEEDIVMFEVMEAR
jgi:hypothetical protein